jgi:hypothetical protein
VLKGRDEALEIRAAKTVAGFETCQSGLREHELLTMVAVEFRDGFGERFLGGPEPAVVQAVFRASAEVDNFVWDCTEIGREGN